MKAAAAAMVTEMEILATIIENKAKNHEKVAFETLKARNDGSIRIKNLQLVNLHVR
jgi:hypothetical protein